MQYDVIPLDTHVWVESTHTSVEPGLGMQVSPTEPIPVLLLIQLADEFGAMGVQAGNVLVSSTANMMRRMPSVFAGAFFGSALTTTAVGLWNFVSSSRPWPSAQVREASHDNQEGAKRAHESRLRSSLIASSRSRARPARTASTSASHS
jgi:hypothetical protein